MCKICNPFTTTTKRIHDEKHIVWKDQINANIFIRILYSRKILLLKRLYTQTKSYIIPPLIKGILVKHQN